MWWFEVSLLQSSCFLIVLNCPLANTLILICRMLLHFFFSWFYDQVKIWPSCCLVVVVLFIYFTYSSVPLSHFRWKLGISPMVEAVDARSLSKSKRKKKVRPQSRLRLLRYDILWPAMINLQNSPQKIVDTFLNYSQSLWLLK